MKRPYLDFYLDLGFLLISTEITHDRPERNTFEYVAVIVILFGYGTRFRLYNVTSPRRLSGV